MSLQYTYILDNLINLNSTITPNFYSIENTLNEISKDQLFEKYKNDLKLIYNEYNLEENDSKENDSKITYENINFLNNVLDIKKKILILNNKYKEYLEKSKDIEKEIEKIEELRNTYNTFNNLYSELIKDNNLNIETSNKENNSLYEKIVYNHNEYLKDNNLINNIIKDDKLLNMNNTIQNKKDKLKKYEEEKSKILNKIILLKETIDIKDITIENSINVICLICDTDKIEYCFNPCGHSYCKRCCDYATNTCHTCRGTITSKIKLFF
jgi:hypothetical protein